MLLFGLVTSCWLLWGRLSWGLVCLFGPNGRPAYLWSFRGIFFRFRCRCPIFRRIFGGRNIFIELCYGFSFIFKAYHLVTSLTFQIRPLCWPNLDQILGKVYEVFINFHWLNFSFQCWIFLPVLSVLLPCDYLTLFLDFQDLPLIFSSILQFYAHIWPQGLSKPNYAYDWLLEARLHILPLFSSIYLAIQSWIISFCLTYSWFDPKATWFWPYI